MRLMKIPSPFRSAAASSGPSSSVSSSTAAVNPPSQSSVWRPDVTVATIGARENRFLLVEELLRGRRVLNQPAGHLEPRETLIDAARRETLEETAWHVKPSHLIAISQWTNAPNGRHFVRFTFAADAERHEPDRPLDTGILRTVWLSRDEIAAEHGYQIEDHSLVLYVRPLKKS